MLTADGSHVLDLQCPGKSCAMHQVDFLPVAMCRVEVAGAGLIQHPRCHASLGRPPKY